MPIRFKYISWSYIQWQILLGQHATDLGPGQYFQVRFDSKSFRNKYQLFFLIHHITTTEQVSKLNHTFQKLFRLFIGEIVTFHSLYYLVSFMIHKIQLR